MEGRQYLPKSKHRSILNAAWVLAFVFGMRKSLWYIMYGLHVRWEGDVGHYIYDLHGVMSIGVCLEQYEEEL